MGVLDLITLVVSLAIVIALGLPLAALLHRRPAPIEVLLFHGGAIGLGLILLVGLIAARLGIFTIVWLGLLIAPVAAGSAVLALKDRSFERIQMPGRYHMGAGLALIVGALAIRSNPIYFVFQTGDMGQYVNTANVLATGGDLIEGFPHGFTVLLGVASLTLGAAKTVMLMPIAGILFLLGVFAVLRSIGAHTIATAVIIVFAAIHPVPNWFSVFPVSEAVYAVFLLAAISFLTTAIREKSDAWALLSGATLGLMLLTRGNAILLVAVALGAAGWASLIGNADESRPFRLLAAGSVVAAAAAWLYNVAFLPHYFVELQLRAFVPGRILSAANRYGLLEPSIGLLFALALGTVMILLALLGMSRVQPRWLVRHASLVWQIALLLTVALSTLAVLRLGWDGLLDGFLRWGPGLLILAVVGLIASVAAQGVQCPPGWSMFLLGAGASGAVLYAFRFAVAPSHAYYLYWDRYLFSEAFPVALILSGIGLTWLIGLRPASETRLSLFLTAGLLALFVALPSARQFKDTVTIAGTQMFGDAFGLLEALDLSTGSDKSAPIVYSGASGKPPGWFFPNTYRAFALPLAQSFHRTVLGMPLPPFGQDAVFHADDARTLIHDAGHERGFVVALSTSDFDGGLAYRSDPHFVKRAVLDYTAPVLGRSADWKRPAAFEFVPFQFEVFELLPSAGGS